MKHYGYFHVACAVPETVIGNVDENIKQILQLANEVKKDTRMIVYPELCISGYTCADLFYQNLLLEKVKDALLTLCKKNDSEALLVVGLPLVNDNHLFNCAAYIYKDKILGIVPKTYIPNYNEYYEKRWFSAAKERTSDTIRIGDQIVPFTDRLLIHDETSGAIIAADICEDLWVAIPPSSHHTIAGANVIANLSASNETIGKETYRRDLVRSHSARCICGYVYCSAGRNESTTDLVFSGHCMVADNGYIIQESTFQHPQRITYGEIDLEKCMSDRIKCNTYMQDPLSLPYEHVYIKTKEVDDALSLVRAIRPYPFVPEDLDERSKRCNEILAIQAAGLAQRLKKIHCNTLVVGISGGLDSTLALIVAKKAFDINGYDSKGIIAVTMPGFGTTKRTHSNSRGLMEALHTTSKEISIKDACIQHYEDIEHDPSLLDITYENSQARERTQILMDLANKYNAIVLGTGDLSELALGWCTYNGDHMSMYAVNASIPKTLVRYLVESYSEEMRKAGREDISEILDDICATPVSPELLPPKENGEIAQITENSIGSYDYHDFFLYHMLRNQYTPKKIYALACIAFANTSPETIKNTMKTFYRRFFTQQFKRSCLPDGVKVGSICLSPRGDWRMPSDASYGMWMKEVDEL